jgi:hypothetical protein
MFSPEIHTCTGCTPGVRDGYTPNFIPAALPRNAAFSRLLARLLHYGGPNARCKGEMCGLYYCDMVV